jgi:hypothetical protein
VSPHNVALLSPNHRHVGVNHNVLWSAVALEQPHWLNAMKVKGVEINKLAVRDVSA